MCFYVRLESTGHCLAYKQVVKCEKASNGKTTLSIARLYGNTNQCVIILITAKTEHCAITMLMKHGLSAGTYVMLN